MSLIPSRGTTLCKGKEHHLVRSETLRLLLGMYGASLFCDVGRLLFPRVRIRETIERDDTRETPHSTA